MQQYQRLTVTIGMHHDRVPSRMTSSTWRVNICYLITSRVAKRKKKLEYEGSAPRISAAHMARTTRHDEPKL